MRSRRLRLAIVLLAIVAAIAVVISALSGYASFGPAQPVPFSHRVHAGDKQISCFFCHPTAALSSNASMPPVEKCMLCHSQIASNFRPIAKLRGYYDRDEPVPWIRVTNVPDFVQFKHFAHVGIRGFDCGVCHGDVKSMDRISQVNKLDMGFCVKCHWKYKYSVSCYTCHY